ncbi:MAG: hypothetical protein Q8P13_04775 [bacterium]|nr:hypothetical protein [bacterium]
MPKTKAKTEAFKLLASSFEKKYKDLLTVFEEKHGESLTWVREKGINVEDVARQTGRSVVAGTAAGVMLLSSGLSPTKELPGVFQQRELLPGTIKPSVTAGKDRTDELRKELLGKLPHEVRPLTKEEERKIEQAVYKILGVRVKAELQGYRLNTSYGYIGTESHLTRYPGDTFDSHFDSEVARANYSRTGMAGGRGAYGYFAPNRQSLTARDAEMEKFYLVVQTFDSPNWGQANAWQWFKHRRMLAINPLTGQAVIGDIADAGPALSTGKHFGGSPEVMDGLGLYPPKAKQGVLFLFLDDSEASKPLGVLQ